MKASLVRSAVVVTALVSVSFLFTATPSPAETPFSATQQQKQQLNSQEPSPASANNESAGTPVNDKTPTAVVSAATDPAGLLTTGSEKDLPVAPPVSFVATAYSLLGRTATGKRVNKGLIAADPSVLPFGTRVRLEAGTYSGEYEVADAGSAVKGKKIDIWTPTFQEACRFGRRIVKLTVLSYGPRRTVQSKHTKR